MIAFVCMLQCEYVLCMYVCMYVCICACQLHTSFTSFGQLLRCAHQCIVNIMKVSSKGTTCKLKYRLYSCLCLRSEEFRDPRYVYSLFARGQQLAMTKLITIHASLFTRWQDSTHGLLHRQLYSPSNIRKDTTPTVP